MCYFCKKINNSQHETIILIDHYSSINYRGLGV